MKSIVKIFLSLFILCVLIITEELYYWFWIKTWFNYQRVHTEKIDISFFSADIRNKLITDITDIIKTTSNNIPHIEIDIDYIILYDLNNNVISKYNTSSFNIIDIINNLNIGTISIYIDNKQQIEYLNLFFLWKKYLYIYETKSHNYSEWYVIPVLIWRVEKVIDNNWYILRDCDRTICQESQR